MPFSNAEPDHLFPRLKIIKTGSMDELWACDEIRRPAHHKRRCYSTKKNQEIDDNSIDIDTDKL